MRIKRLDVMGFKSFPERVQIPFAPGISAVVGPNGCGKSNIVDAIRWVMGEQSPKQLRGRQMDDILFNGAKSHDASGLAEVTLVLSDDRGPGSSTLGPSEISITRRLYRSGDSEYLINRVPCRLKDITQFFMDTGMGTKAFVFIELGRIGGVVDARPEVRRALIDEAAGITRYKAQKKEAERKIEATEQNLVNISSVMAENKRQINSLTRAARKAAAYKELQSELKEIDLALTSMEMASLAEKEGLRGRDRAELEKELSGLLSSLERVEVELEQNRLDIVEREKLSESKSAALYELQKENSKLRQEDEFLARQAEEIQERRGRINEDLVRLADQKRRQGEEVSNLRTEMSDLASRMEEKRAALAEIRAENDDLRREADLAAGRRDELASELSTLRSRAARLEETLAGHERLAENQAARQEELGEELSRLREDSAGLDSEISKRNRRREDLSLEIDDRRAEMAGLRSDLEEKKEEVKAWAHEERRADARLAAEESKLDTLKEIKANFGWYPEGVQALMAEPDLREAGVLGPVAEKIRIPDGYEAAVEAALGERLGFVLVRDRQAAARALSFLQEKGLGRCGFVCADEIASEAGGRDLTTALLGPYDLAETTSEAAALSPGRTVFTRDGSYFGQNGLVVGGKPQNDDKGLLARLKEIESLESVVLGLEEEKERLAGLTREATLGLESLERSIEGFAEKLRAGQAELVEVEKQLSGLKASRGDLERRLSSLTRSLEAQNVEARRLAEQKESARVELESLEAEEFDLNQDLEKASEEVKAYGAELETAREKEQRANLDAGSLGEKFKTAQNGLARTEEWLRDIESQIEARERELSRTGIEMERLVERREQISEALVGFDDRVETAEKEAREARRLVDEARTNLNEKENQARQSRRRRSELDEKIRKLELELQELGFKKQALIDRVANDYRLDLTSLPEEDRPAPPDDFEPEEAARRRHELRQKIENMGEVNLTAIGEHEALQERYDFYRRQYEDLTSAIENLKNSIARINRTCKIRFKSTFEAVDQKLREIFPLLFEGGEAWLSLTDESDVLDSGVEIHVHPPGKKLTVMSLLSGGEKALVALALIFALYLIKPSPFCLLDETDAPLDEANIDRFNRLLKKLGQSSQIIMVTHNKRTMQISQTLYGVTMEEPGISKMVSVNLSELEDFSENAQMVQAG